MPRLDVAARDLASLIELSEAFDARTSGPGEDVVSSTLKGLLGNVPLAFARTALRAAPGEFAVSMLVEMGVDPVGSAIFIPSMSSGAPALFAFELKDRRRFSAALEELSEGELRRVSIGGEEAVVLAAESDRPIACLARQSHAYCQLGVAVGASALAPLRVLVAPAAPPLGSVEPLGRAFSRLRPEAHVYAVVHGEAAARALAELAASFFERAHRFEDAEAAAIRARVLARSREAAEAVSAAAAGFYVTRDDVRADLEVAFSERGARVLRDLQPDAPRSSVIPRWFETPALARFLIAVRGERVEKLLALGGLELPRGMLNGELALLLFGVDPECSAAKHPSTGPLGWAFLLPSAFAAGVRERPPMWRLEEDVRRALEREVSSPKELVVQRSKDESSPKSSEQLSSTPEVKPNPSFSGRAFGSAFEMHVFDDLALLGTGPGSGAAAVRRLGALPAAAPSSAAPAPFFVAALHPRAIDAAFEAGRISRENRRELRVLDDLRRRGQLWLQQLESIRLEARAFEPERRVKLELALQR